MRVRSVKEFGEFQTPLRNIRLRMDATWLQLDLFQSQTLGTPVPDEADPVMAIIVNGGRPIVETSCYLRLTFDFVTAVKIHDEFSDPDLDAEMIGKETLLGRCVWPIVEVLDSGWKASFPDHCAAGHASQRHWKIFSMETVVDVLGVEPVGEWLEASPEEASMRLTPNLQK